MASKTNFYKMKMHVHFRALGFVTEMWPFIEYFPYFFPHQWSGAFTTVFWIQHKKGVSCLQAGLRSVTREWMQILRLQFPCPATRGQCALSDSTTHACTATSICTGKVLTAKKSCCTCASSSHCGILSFSPFTPAFSPPKASVNRSSDSN